MSLRFRISPSFFRRLYSTKNVSTIDQEQMERFDLLASKWWNPRSVMGMLHSMNRFRVPLLKEHLAKANALKEDPHSATPLKGLNILDLGCGGGILSESLAALGAKVTAIDANKSLITIARQRQKEQNLTNIEYHEGGIEDYVSQFENKFDVVACMEVLEHIQHPKEFVNLTTKCAKEGASIFVTTNSKSMISKFFFVTVLENILRILPHRTHPFEKFVAVEELHEMLIKDNCKPVFTKGIVYIPLTGIYFLTRFTNIDHYFVHAIKGKST